MSSVTRRVKEVKQPRGGYVKPSEFTTEVFDDGIELYQEENIHASIVGMAVDYMSRMQIGIPVNEAFSVSLYGAEQAEQNGVTNAKEIAHDLADCITGLNKPSVISACKLVTFDVWARNMLAAARMSQKYTDVNPDSNTIKNIQSMVKRCRVFWKKYGPVISDGFTFLPNGYSTTVNSGDGDCLTKDTLWDIKVSKQKLNSKQTLQLLMYWIMGQHSGSFIFEGVTHIGVFNPRLNTAYRLAVADVDKQIIQAVEQDVICYW